ncbi:MAG: tRNA (adenosine(37)-N6)-threonylcarbamoyltransferase complex transferase subunit TsaD, partial [Gaiellales bacterium]
QEAVMETLVVKLERAVARTAARSVSIGGGVARNRRLRELIGASPALSGLELVFPAMDLCSDNAAMIAGLGALLHGQGQSDDLLLEARAR